MVYTRVRKGFLMISKISSISFNNRLNNLNLHASNSVKQSFGATNALPYEAKATELRVPDMLALNSSLTIMRSDVPKDFQKDLFPLL